MKFIFALSLKNLWRYKRRTLITASAIAMGLAMFIWMDAFILGIEKESERNSILYETGSAQIMDALYYENIEYMPLKHVIENPDTLVDSLTALNIPATKRVSFSGEIFFGGNSLPLKFFGIDLATNARVFDLESVLVEDSRFLSPGENEIMIGYELADTLGITQGNFVDVRTRTRDGKAQTLSLKVVGIMNCLNPVLNVNLGIIPLSVVDRELEMRGGVTEIPLMIPEYKKLQKELTIIKEKLGGKLADLEIRAWNDLGGNLLDIMHGKRNIIFVLLFLLGVIAAVGISNTMLMAVFERIKEIGMMRAMGMLDKDIKLAFLIEAGGIGFIGSLAGVVLALILNMYSIYIGFDFGWLIKGIDFGISFPSLFRASWNIETIIIAPLIGILVSIFVSRFPAGKALRMDITECLRHQ